MAMRRQKAAEESGSRWLEVDASMTGTLTFKDPVNLQINGRFDGTLDTRGNLSIGQQAQVKATIHGESLVIGGSVQGTITASSRVELQSTARVNGKITTPRLIVQDGAMLQGTLEMSGEHASNQSMSVDELARYLEVDASTVLQWAQGGRLPAQRQGDAWRFERSKIEAWLAQEKIK